MLLVVWSCLGGVLFASCAGDPAKRKVTVEDAGAGGEDAEGGAAGATDPGSGGSGISLAGQSAAGAPPLGGSGGAPAPDGGMGGQAPVAPFCFELGEGGAGGNGGAAQGGAGGDLLYFNCSHVTGTFDEATSTIKLDTLPGWEPTTTGTFLAKYSYGPRDPLSICQEGMLSNAGTTLELPLTEAPFERVQVTQVTLRDECDSEVRMDIEPGVPGFCWGFHVNPPAVEETEWSISCYEGYGSDCDTACPPPQ
jgi:hypothetical protein